MVADYSKLRYHLLIECANVRMADRIVHQCMNYIAHATGRSAIL